jgi:hypothetical protein
MAKETVQIERATYEQLVAQNQRGQQAQKQLRERDGGDVINAAIAAGRIAPQNKDYWLREYERDPQGASQTIASLQPVPLSLFTEQSPPTSDQETADALEAARSFIPELRRGQRKPGQSRDRREQRAATVERQSLPPSTAAASVSFRDGLGLTLGDEEGEEMSVESVAAVFPEVDKRIQGRGAGGWRDALRRWR